MGHAVDRLARGRGHRRGAVIDPVSRVRDARRTVSKGALRDVDVAFEFTEPSAAEDNVEALLQAGVHVVCGTTGWTPRRDLGGRAEAAGRAVIVAPNFSVGMNLFGRIVRHAARAIGSAGLHQPYVLEMHHAGKVDAPSGTARWLAQRIARSDPRRPTVQEGDPHGRLAEGAVHVVGVRAGYETGTHVVGFDGEHDAIELRHRARSRDGFALGAVLAAEWAMERSGLHTFDRVLDDLLAAERRRRS
jgi:4-hydroxy-tetrahydrodipicolinate reductase